MKNRLHPAAVVKRFGLLVLIMSPFVMAACSGSSAGGISGRASVRALSLPDRIELTHEEGQSAAGHFRAAYGDAGSDYSLAAKHTREDDTDALDMVNTILGIVKDTGYTGAVNQGPYMALVRQIDENPQHPSGDSETPTTTEQIIKIYVEVTRVSNSSPMIVKIWVEDKEGSGEGPMLIRGVFSVTQGVSAAYPYGVMFARLMGTVLDGDGNEGADMFAMAISVGAAGGNVVTENFGDLNESDTYATRRRAREAAINAGYLSDDECRDPVYYAEDDQQHRVLRHRRSDARSGAAATRPPDLQFETDDNHG